MSAIDAKDDLTIDVLRARLGRRYTIERQP